MNIPSPSGAGRRARYKLRPVRSIVCWTLCAALLTGCAWRGEGLVERSGGGAVLQSSTGKRFRLLYEKQRVPLHHLEGLVLVLEARRFGKTLTVETWSVPEGHHGMAVWIGKLQWNGRQLGLEDHGSGAYYVLDDASVAALRGSVGSPVMVEGYIDGPHRIKVLHHHTLVDPNPDQ